MMTISVIGFIFWLIVAFVLGGLLSVKFWKHNQNKAKAVDNAESTVVNKVEDAVNKVVDSANKTGSQS